MALVSKTLLPPLLFLTLIPFGFFGVSNKKIQNTSDHNHSIIRAEHHNAVSHKHTNDRHDEDVNTDSAHSHSYTHRHGPGLPEHTHEDSQSNSAISAGFVFVALFEETNIMPLPNKSYLSSFSKVELYLSAFNTSIFRPPIA